MAGVSVLHANLFIFAAIGTGVFMATKAGYTKIYPNIDDHGMAYFWFSVVLAIVIHDAYFYFTHRLMHTKLLYAKFHAVHHRSNNPSPWAAFSFHPYEAVVEAMIVPLLAFTMPIHKFAILAFLVYMTFMNVIGHLGYELYPKSLSIAAGFFGIIRLLIIICTIEKTIVTTGSILTGGTGFLKLTTRHILITTTRSLQDARLPWQPGKINISRRVRQHEKQ